jgi:hypothetical protein
MSLNRNFHVVAFSEEEEFNHGDLVDSLTLDSSADDSMGHDYNHGHQRENETIYRETLPGTDGIFIDDSDDEEEAQPEEVFEEQKDTSWEQDRNVSKFMSYISSMYPHKIPKHDGTSPAACEVAIKFLKKLIQEISVAIRKDDAVSPILPIRELENDYKYKIMSDIVVLKDHKSKLEKKISDSLNNKHKKKASADIADNQDIENVENVYEDILMKEALNKQAFTPKLQIVVTPFERALSGIIINSVVAGGKPFEDVFEFLKKKYKLDNREELALMQVIMDSGFPIFKDRGTISSEEGSEDESYGIEFIKGYFA